MSKSFLHNGDQQQDFFHLCVKRENKNTTQHIQPEKNYAIATMVPVTPLWSQMNEESTCLGSNCYAITHTSRSTRLAFTKFEVSSSLYSNYKIPYTVRKNIFFYEMRSSYNTLVQVTIRVGTLGYDLGPAICDTCQKAS